MFPVPNVCEYLTRETRERVYLTTPRDDQGSKVGGFFKQVDDMYREMVWQKKLRGEIACWKFLHLGEAMLCPPWWWDCLYAFTVRSKRTASRPNVMCLFD